jgi:hypothetical protein
MKTTVTIERFLRFGQAKGRNTTATRPIQPAAIEADIFFSPTDGRFSLSHGTVARRIGGVKRGRPASAQAVADPAYAPQSNIVCCSQFMGFGVVFRRREQ